MQHLVVLLEHEMTGYLPLLNELKRQGVEVDVMGPTSLMTSFYKNKEIFFNLHVGEPTLQSVQLRKPELILVDNKQKYKWLSEIQVPIVGWGRLFDSASTTDHQLVRWFLPFTCKFARKFCFGPGQEAAAVDSLKQLLLFDRGR